MGDDLGVRVEPLVARARSGDEAAREEILRLLLPVVLRYAVARLPRPLAEDVAQEACLGILEALPRYEDRGLSFLSVAFRIAHHKVVDAWRVPAREDLRAALPDEVDPEPGPAERAERQERLALARELLDRLPSQQRDVILLRVVAGLSSGEVADVLEMTPGAVRVAQHRALARLRDEARVAEDVRAEPALHPLAGDAT